MATEKIKMKFSVWTVNGVPQIRSWASNDKVEGFVIELEGDTITDIAYQILDYVYEGHYSAFREGYARVCRGRLCGYVDIALSEVVEAKYDDAGLVSDGFAHVKLGEKYGYLSFVGSSKPQNWTECEYDHAWEFRNGRGRVKKDNLYGYVGDTYDSKNRIPCQFEDAYDFNLFEPYAVVKQNGKYGMINKSGEWVIEPKFDEYFEKYRGLGDQAYNATIGDKQYWIYQDGSYKEIN